MTGRKADVLQAAYLASEVAQRLVRAGNEVSLEKIYFSFGE